MSNSFEWSLGENPYSDDDIYTRDISVEEWMDELCETMILSSSAMWTSSLFRLMALRLRIHPLLQIRPCTASIRKRVC